jgi:hypothetical protein
LGTIEAADGVQNTGLPRTIRPYNGHDLSVYCMKADVEERSYAPELKMKIPDIQVDLL